MYITIKTVIALLRRKKVQMALIGIILVLVSSLLYVGLGLLFQTSPFEKMFERSHAAESVYMLSNKGMDVKDSLAFFKKQGEVSDVVNYHMLLASVEFNANGKKETNFAFLTPFQTDKTVDLLYVTPAETARIPSGNEVIINYNLAKSKGLAVGDEISLFYGEKTYPLTIKELVVDPHFSNAFISPDRFFVAPDFFVKNGIVSDTELIGIKYADYQKGTETILNEKYQQFMSGRSKPNYISYQSFATSYNMIFGVIAGVLLMVSFFIFIIVTFVIKSTVGNMILQQYRSIGVKRVIGYSGSQIRGSFLWLFLLLGTTASAIGTCIGLPIRNLINNGIGYDLQVDIKSGADFIMLLTVILITGLIYLFTVLAARKANQIKPVQAIKYGMPENKTSRNTFRMHHFPKLPFIFLLAVKQLLVNRRKSLTTVLMLSIIVYSALLINNTGKTLSTADHFLKNLTGTRAGDYSITDSSKNSVTAVLAKIGTLEDTEYSTFAAMNPNESTVGVDSKEIATGGMSYYGQVPDDFLNLASGRAPLSPDEIVISGKLAKESGKTVGEYIEISNQAGKSKFLVSGLFNTVTFNSMGYVRIITEVSSDLQQSNGYYLVYSSQKHVVIKDKELEIKKLLSDSANISRYDTNASNMLSTLAPFPVMVNMLLIVFIIVCGVIVLNWTIMDIQQMTRSYGVFKAVGFTNKNITRILTLRALIVTFAGVCMGFVLNMLTMNAVMAGIFSITPFSTITLPVLFDTMGNLVLISLFVVITWLATVIPCRKLNRISPKNLIAE